jgi:multidrug transporter EmrE-like cation transporter
MVWVRSEYAEELAVVTAWLSAFLPWNVTYSTLSGVGSVLFVRFPFFQVRYIFGISISEGMAVTTPLGALAYQEGQSIAVAYAAWAVGAGVVAAAVALGLLLYRYEERVGATIDPVRVMGALLSLAGVVLTGATWLLWTRGFPGLPIPVGVMFLYLFGGTLLLARRE